MIRLTFFLLISSLCTKGHSQAADSPIPQYIYRQTTEDQVLRVLTGQQDYKSQRITERRSQKGRALARQYLAEKLQELGFSPQAHKYSASGTNVFSILPATVESNEFVVVGAHFDSTGGPGANDNASGVAVVMSMAEGLKKQNQRKLNVIFCFFDEEENGLVGSHHFAKKLFDEKFRVHSVHTIDQLAYDTDGDRAIEVEAAPDDLFNFYQQVNVQTGSHVLLLKSPITSTDHHSFRKMGFRSLGLTEEYYHGDTTPCYHSACDTYETVNLDYLLTGSSFWFLVISQMIY